MAKHEMPETPDVSYIHNEGVAHEDTDMSLGGIVKFVIHLILLVSISAGLMWGLFNYLNRREERIEGRETPSTLLKRDRSINTSPDDLFPQPRLQTAPVPDLRDYNREIDARLGMVDGQSVYRWVDKEKGIVAIPIEEAKKKLLDSGMMSAPPAAPGGQAQSVNQTATPAPDAGAPPAARPAAPRQK